MDLEKVKEEIIELRKSKSCSQATLLALCKDTKLSEEELLDLAIPFSGGIGRTFEEGTCGALIAALMAIGFSNSENKIALAQFLFNDFKDEYMSVRCDEISKKGQDHSSCVDCCIFAASKVIDFLE